MNRDLFLSILSMDSYNRGYAQRVNGLSDSGMIGTASILSQSDIRLGFAAVNAGFYALSYDYNGETIVSYRGTDGLNDLLNGWTVGAGWTDQAQANLSIEFYKAATGLRLQ